MKSIRYGETTWERVIVHNSGFGTRPNDVNNFTRKGVQFGAVNFKPDKEAAYREVCEHFRHAMVHPNSSILAGCQGVTGPRNDKMRT